MSWIDKIFHKKPKTSRYAPSLSGSLPTFSQFGTNIYASDVVQQALKCIVDEMKKLNPTHVRYNGNDSVPVKGSTIQDVLREPNPLMTTSEFIEKTTWLLMMNYNVFIMPVYRTWIDQKTGVERRYYEALYPLKPIQADFIEDASGRLFVHFFFGMYDTTIPYDDLIHIKYNYSVNQYMGGNELGQPDHTALLETLNLNKSLLDGVAKAMNASYAVNGVVKYNTLMDDGKTLEAVKELERKLARNESGILPLDMKAEFTPLPRDVKLIDENTLKFVDEKILRNFGVPLCILTGDYTKEQFEAFYQKTLENLIISFGQAFTKKLFTEREKAFGNRIEFYPKELIFMSVDQTLKMIEILSPTGSLYENEKRTALGLKPMEELEGKRFMSLNWIDANNASEYQVGKVSVDVVDEEKEVI